MKKRRKVCIKIFLSLLLIGIALLILFKNNIKSLKSIKKLNDYGIYEMTYYGDYKLDAFLKDSVDGNGEMQQYVAKKASENAPDSLDIPNNGCTTFVTNDSQNNLIYARNFDFSYTPSMLLHTNPSNGYASVSVINLTFLGYSEDNIPANFLGMYYDFPVQTLSFFPIDGMNEKGVSISLLATANNQSENIVNKIFNLNTTAAIRLVLDKASNVEDAINILKNYHMYISDDSYFNYLIADNTGSSVIIDYCNDNFFISKSDQNPQIISTDNCTLPILTVFFDEGTSDEDIQNVGNQIKSQPEVLEIKSESADEAWEKMKKEYWKNTGTNDGFNDDNPLVNSFNYQIYVKKNYSLTRLISYIQSLEHVRGINQGNITAEEWITSRIKTSASKLDMYNTIFLLNATSLFDIKSYNNTQYSIIYNLTEQTGKIWTHKNEQNILDFKL